MSACDHFWLPATTEERANVEEVIEVYCARCMQVRVL